MAPLDSQSAQLADKPEIDDFISRKLAEQSEQQEHDKAQHETLRPVDQRGQISSMLAPIRISSRACVR